MTSAFPHPSPFGFHHRFFKNIDPPTKFLEVSSTLQKKEWKVGNYVHSSKNLRNNIWLLLCVLVGQFNVFWMFLLLLAVFDMDFSKDFPG